MNLVLPSERGELHRHQRLELQEAKLRGRLGLGNVRNWQVVFGTDLLAREDNMHRVPGLGFGTVQEHVHSFDVAMDESRLPEGLLRSVEIPSTQDDIDILRVANRGFVHPRHPGRHGVAAHYGVGDFRLLQSTRGAEQPAAHLFHGPDHPFQGDLADLRRLARSGPLLLQAIGKHLHPSARSGARACFNRSCCSGPRLCRREAAIRS